MRRAVGTRCGALLWLLYTICLPPAVQAGTVAELQAAGQLEIDASLYPHSDIVPGQKLTLSLTIATDRWFSGGTLITPPEVPGLVILQTEQFASNASERRGDSNWVIQRWSLDLYPQRAGDFTVPPVKARVRVNTANGEDVQGTLASPPLRVSVALPPALQELEDEWVASPAFSVDQEFDRPLTGLRVGDAFERVVVFEASDVMAMMLPSLAPATIPGLAAYAAPPVLEDNNNRGQSLASRTERISYVVEAEGRYLLRARDYYWWDTSQQTLRLLALPAVEITVGSAVAGPLAGGGEPDPLRLRRWLLPGAAGLAALGGLLWLARRYLPRLPLAKLAAGVRTAWRRLCDLRKPALARQLNPGSNAGE
jgi:hypothetical protein